MDQRTFGLLFREAVQRALSDADAFRSEVEPLVEFHGDPDPQRPITMDETVERLWLSSDLFNFIVDVGAYLGARNPPLIFVRPSGHEPRPFSGTWRPDDLGPFKVIGSVTRGLGS